jgi:ATP-dependent DNA helicase UvrD/PcrA
MPITSAQVIAANAQQDAAASDPAPQVRVVAGPGTGKSRTIEKRVGFVLGTGVAGQSICVISFTRATWWDLTRRIEAFCQGKPYAAQGVMVRVSTMHSLALRILRFGNLLLQYPSDPVILDDWEQETIYDQELAVSMGCTPRRAQEIRLAYDASWQTLNPASINQAQITNAEQMRFNAFHGVVTNLYSCVLPGEVIHKCVEAIDLGQLQLAQLPPIGHLIVDEFQDLNLCDQRFVELLTGNGSILFVAGDDDQSVYLFRHANPNGIIQFQITYPASTLYILTDCFRCTPAVLTPALALIQRNPNRVPKALVSLYGASAPPVQGSLRIWSFADAETEARAIAASCQALIAAGLANREDEILILISNRRVQLPLITRELGNLGLPYDTGQAAGRATDPAIRAVLCILRIANDILSARPDYVAFRALLGLLQNVGLGTIKFIIDACVTNVQNFRALFFAAALPGWLQGGRVRGAVQRMMNIRAAVSAWNMADTLATRSGDIQALLTAQVFGGNQVIQASWTALSGTLPPQMTMSELLEFLHARTEAESDLVLSAVLQRTGAPLPAAPQQKRIRVLTMHGAKGLDGSVVFIPSVEQGLIPSFRAIQAAGLVIEQRRLLYVSVTRAKAACIISHSALHVAPESFVLAQRSHVSLPRSQFLNEMQVASNNRAGGLTPAEATAIVADITNL